MTLRAQLAFRDGQGLAGALADLAPVWRGALEGGVSSGWCLENSEPSLTPALRYSTPRQPWRRGNLL